MCGPTRFFLFCNELEYNGLYVLVNLNDFTEIHVDTSVRINMDNPRPNTFQLMASSTDEKGRSQLQT